jgi:hypothetical protein
MTRETREDWLVQAMGEVRPFFELAGLNLATQVRLTCGFPSTARRTGAVAEVWASDASDDGTIEVLISPTLADPRAVFTTLLGALCRATDGSMSPKSDSLTRALAVMLVPGGVAGDGFDAQYGEIIASLGEYPHAALRMQDRPKQSTRMLKAVCPSCGYTVRLTSKWAQQGMPTCHDGNQFALEGGEEQ